MKKLSWSRRYRLGVEVNKCMDHFATLEEVAVELGITKQNAYTETVLALGTLVCLMRARLGLPLDMAFRETPEIGHGGASSLGEIVN